MEISSISRGNGLEISSERRLGPIVDLDAVGKNLLCLLESNPDSLVVQPAA
jgi:hypothetical protein